MVLGIEPGSADYKARVRTPALSLGSCSYSFKKHVRLRLFPQRLSRTTVPPVVI